jgi:pimeloyl-ACP methyl ester carboxylesterase
MEAQMQGLEHGRFIELKDGIKLFVRDLAPEGAVSGAPILCLHGLTRNSKDFEDLLPRFAAAGRRALALDVRGRGLSDRDPEPMRYNPMTYAQDVIAVLDALSVEKAAFVGTSMGGIISMIVAATAPQRIERVALNDVGPALDPAGIARIAGYVGKSQPVVTWDDAADAIWRINGVAFPDAAPSFYYRMAKRTFRQDSEGVIALDYDPEIAAPFRSAGGAAPADMWPLYEALKPIPTLVIRGALSDLLSPAIVAEMKQRKPDLETAEVPRVGHAPMLDEPAAWAALTAFLHIPTA